MKRGFGSPNYDATRLREVAAMGGRAAHASGKAHEYTRADAAAAGRIGGLVSSRDRERMAQIGRLGAAARARKRAARLATDSPAPAGGSR